LPEVVQKGPASPPPPGEFEKYSRFSSILRSFFWRFYDNLFSLVLLNLAWFFVTATIFLFFWHFDLIRIDQGLSLWGFYGCYLSLCLFSVGWASVVFKIFHNQSWSWADLWTDTLKFGGRALALSALSCLVFLLAFLSYRYYSALKIQSPILWIFLVGTVSWGCLFWAMTMIYQWPILFFQDASFSKTLYRSILLALSRGLLALALLLLFGLSFLFFTLTMVPWFFFGGAYFFSLQCVALEKVFLDHRIILNDKPIEEMLDSLDSERARGWADFIKPWEHR
jgi:hypothetical protein